MSVLFKLCAVHQCIQTSVAHIGTHLLPEWAEQARSETVVGSVCHQVGQTLTHREGGDKLYFKMCKVKS